MKTIYYDYGSQRFWVWIFADFGKSLVVFGKLPTTDFSVTSASVNIRFRFGNCMVVWVAILLQKKVI